MKITKEIVRKTAHLARLTFSEEGETQMVQDLQKMVNWVDKLQEVDTDDVEPLTSMSPEINVFRADEVANQLARASTFRNAPKHDSEFFRVPKVIK